VEKKNKLLVLSTMMLDEDMREYVDKNGGHDSGSREERKKAITLVCKIF